ncbi:hypothetical protein CAEBREN_03040 [Caenorhabditis brenneri]|uniref:non-specific serine/threonine protein kinase n=1 Tax=Caenorhabditis brenneri TaxID=135651 RepID=G0NZQ2_CAEBE|nr:hypothetical protein CAEBREN_03040 [Caenorhabditis brenneri]
MDKYEKVRLVGRGAFGACWLCRDKNDASEILIALDHLHSKHIVHRDLKPQNVLMNREKTILKLSDFGISNDFGPNKYVIGTPNYLSPETCEGRPYTRKSDVWSLGCVLYELVQLERAFDGESLPAIVMKITQGKLKPMGEHVSNEVKSLVNTLLETNEKSRPNVSELLGDPIFLPYLVTKNFLIFS